MNLYGFVVVLFLNTAQTVPDGNSDYLRMVEQARVHYQNGNFAASEKFLVAAVQMLEPGEESERAARLAELGDVYVSEDELVKAEKTYSESLAIYKRLPDKSKIVLLMRNLSATYSLELRGDDALRLLKQALKLAKTIPQLDDIFNQALQMISASRIKYATPELLNNLGAAYITQHRAQKAEDILKQALKA